MQRVFIIKFRMMTKSDCLVIFIYSRKIALAVFALRPLTMRML